MSNWSGIPSIVPVLPDHYSFYLLSCYSVLWQTEYSPGQVSCRFIVTFSLAHVTANIEYFLNEAQCLYLVKMLTIVFPLLCINWFFPETFWPHSVAGHPCGTLSFPACIRWGGPSATSAWRSLWRAARGRCSTSKTGGCTVAMLGIQPSCLALTYVLLDSFISYRRTYDTWHVTPNMWHMVGCENSLKILAS